jgi:hypothetical protein
VSRGSIFSRCHAVPLVSRGSILVSFWFHHLVPLPRVAPPPRSRSAVVIGVQNTRTKVALDTKMEPRSRRELRGLRQCDWSLEPNTCDINLDAHTLIAGIVKKVIKKTRKGKPTSSSKSVEKLTGSPP